MKQYYLHIGFHKTGSKFIQKKILVVFTKQDRLKNECQLDHLRNLNQIAKTKLNKKFFNTSIKQVNTIILLKKFLMSS